MEYVELGSVIEKFKKSWKMLTINLKPSLKLTSGSVKFNEKFLTKFDKNIFVLIISFGTPRFIPRGFENNPKFLKKNPQFTKIKIIGIKKDEKYFLIFFLLSKKIITTNRRETKKYTL